MQKPSSLYKKVSFFLAASELSLNINIFTPSRYEDIKLVIGCFAIMNLKTFLCYFKDTLVLFKRQ